MTGEGKWRDRGCCVEERTFTAIMLTWPESRYCRWSTGRQTRPRWVWRTISALISGGFRSVAFGPGTVYPWRRQLCPVLRLMPEIALLCRCWPDRRCRPGRSPFGCRSSPSTPCFSRTHQVSHGTRSTFRPSMPFPKTYRGLRCSGTGRTYLRQTVP